MVYSELKQQGLMRIKEDGPWMQAQAGQYFTVDKPGFIWKARVNMNPFLYFAGMDKYKEGKGHMNIKILSTDVEYNNPTIYPEV
ncbi:DUF6920 family protein [Thermincola potens]|uniref:Uncharacterized protein n=1 Tax=Thermincola potens (strain JR) TaxID=635013 RepID=D5XBS4_THEPJ|nr:DUF6544 family protein [Thermincola potens]ADG81472.1 conserved hypothetical protein [Thermincola potens JR]